MFPEDKYSSYDRLIGMPSQYVQRGDHSKDSTCDTYAYNPTGLTFIISAYYIADTMQHFTLNAETQTHTQINMT